MRPGNPPPRRRGNLRVGTREREPGGRGANRANPPPSDPAPARQVTFQVTYGVVGLTGLTRLTGGWWGGNPALREPGRASRPYDWPRLAMVAGAASL